MLVGADYLVLDRWDNHEEQNRKSKHTKGLSRSTRFGCKSHVHAYVSSDNVYSDRDLGTGDTKFQATKRATTRLRGGTDTGKTWIACRQSRGRKLWDLAFRSTSAPKNTEIELRSKSCVCIEVLTDSVNLKKYT